MFEQLGEIKDHFYGQELVPGVFKFQIWREICRKSLFIWEEVFN